MSNDGQSNFEHANIEAMFDLSFKRFLTLNVVRVAYVVGLVLIGLNWLVEMVIQLNRMIQHGIFVRSMLAIIAATVAVVVYVLLYRVALELVVVLFRIGENTVRTEPVQTAGDAGESTGDAG